MKFLDNSETTDCEYKARISLLPHRTIAYKVSNNFTRAYEYQGFWFRESGLRGLMWAQDHFIPQPGRRCLQKILNLFPLRRGFSSSVRASLNLTKNLQILAKWNKYVIYMRMLTTNCQNEISVSVGSDLSISVCTFTQSFRRLLVAFRPKTGSNRP
ncbi:hypothetical protein POM88_045989 [Heracleum sosnowskyi]|uniref:Uncharacterized protein n=1 Tax=Heracleum sosnowskyi TaxID=360622 RepID=A0AAD8M4A0_9APIA|nr:hypothetical protein POM88_045989 [Heracleum sosnowskyi]